MNVTQAACRYHIAFDPRPPLGDVRKDMGTPWFKSHHLCSSCCSLSIQVLHIGNLLTLAFSLGCAFSPNTDALIVFRFLCEQSRKLLSVRMLSWFQPDYQQVHLPHAVEVLSEIYLRLTNGHPLWLCTPLDPLLVRMPYWSLYMPVAPDPIFRPCCGSYRWRLHRSNTWHQMGIHHHCQSVFIHFFVTWILIMLFSRLWCSFALWNSTSKRNICACYSPTSRQKIHGSGGICESPFPSSTKSQQHNELSMG